MTARVLEGGTNDARPTFKFSVVNLGKASAYDARLSIRNTITGLSTVAWEAIELPVTTPNEILVSLVDGSGQHSWRLRTDMSTAIPEGAPHQLRLVFELTWRQWPAMKRERRLRWPVNTSDEGYVVILGARERGLISTALADIGSGIADAWTIVWANVRNLF